MVSLLRGRREVSRYERRSAGSGFLTRLIILIILIPVAIAAVAYFLSPSGPFSKKADVIPAPVIIGPIHKQDKLITATTQATKIETASTQNILPFTKDEWQYQAVFTVTAGLDLSKINDSDIQVAGDGQTGYTITIRLPNPEIFSNELDSSRSQVLSHNEDFLSGLSKNPNLVGLLQDAARKEVLQQVIEQGQLLADAKTNGEEDIRNLIMQANQGIAQHINSITFVYGPAPTGTPNTTPRATAAPA
jgi:hypothetical protein